MTDTVTYEQSLLRAIFSTEKARELFRVANIDHFTDERRDLYRAFYRLHTARMPVTKESMMLELASIGTMDQAVASDYLDGLLSLPEPPNVYKLAEGIGVLRKREELSKLKAFLDTPEALRDGCSESIKRINAFNLTTHRVSTKKISTLSEVWERMMSREGKQKTYSLGIGDIGPEMLRTRGGEFGIIAADSGVGKTSALVASALHNAKAGVEIGVISIEMTEDELCYRAAAMECGISNSLIDDNDISEAQHQTIMYQLQQNRHVYDRMKLVDPSVVYDDEVHGYINEMISRWGTEIVFIDYMQRIHARGVTDRTERVSVVSESITAIAKSTGVAIIGLSQMARDNGKNNANGGLDRLKHAGQLGHDAHWVLVMEEDREASGTSEEYKVVVFRAVKNRKGKKFEHRLQFFGATQKFAPFAPVPFSPAQFQSNRPPAF